MPTGRSANTAASSSTESTRRQKATALLRADHKHVDELFKQFEKAKEDSEKEQIVAEICTELSVHAEVEEELFYPTVKAALDDHELVPEAIVEHQALKDLIAQVKDAEPDGEMYDAKVKVLGEYVKHHVKEEQDEMFPKAEKSDVDMLDLGERIKARKEELLASGAY
jgi:hemerythrin superfamily protein